MPPAESDDLVMEEIYTFAFLARALAHTAKYKKVIKDF